MVRKYRADAVVTLLGMPVFARKGVGAAFAAIRAAAEGERRLIALRFAGGSHPERTHGLLYDGSLEEIIVEHASTPERGSYFGFVTSSKDESYEQAKKRILNGKTGTYASYVAAAGVHIAGCARCETGRFEVDGSRRLELAELIQRIREGFSAADRVATELVTRGSSAARTFLYAMLAALRSTETSSQLNYVHNAKDYRLEWERTPGSTHRRGHGGQRFDQPGRRCDAIHGPAFGSCYTPSFDLSALAGQPIHFAFANRVSAALVSANQPGMRARGGATESEVHGGNMRRSKLHFFWRDRTVRQRFRGGVSLHSHTLHSEESLAFIPRYTGKLPLIGDAIASRKRDIAPRPAGHWTSRERSGGRLWLRARHMILNNGRSTKRWA